MRNQEERKAIVAQEEDLLKLIEEMKE